MGGGRTWFSHDRSCIHSLNWVFSPCACWSAHAKALQWMRGVDKVPPREAFSPVTVRPDELERCLEFILKRVGATEGFVQREQLDQSSSRDYKW